MQTHELMRFRAGNEKIFAALFLSLKPRLRRQIRTYMPGDRDAADDLFQGVCMKIFSHRNAYRGSGPLAAWCARLCARFCIDHLRAEARALRRIPLVDAPFDIAADSRSESDRTSDAEALQARDDAIADAFVALPPRKRAVAIAFFYFEWSVSRIAMEFKLLSSTVWTMLSQTRVILRKRLALLVGRSLAKA
jgi:RNA polymerase sigma factor (sigma-70 family)